MQDLTCDLTAIPKDKLNKKRTLSAVVIAVLPIKTKASTIRRNVVLRDEYGECVMCVWGNHTQILNESSVGRSITGFRVCVQEFEGALQVSMPKDSSITIGNTPKSLPILNWLYKVGNSIITVPQALALSTPSVVAIHGILSKVTSETITMKEGKVVQLTTVSIADGPPHAVVLINFWHARPDQVTMWESMLHQAVKANMIRCNVKAERGNSYESIGALSRITIETNTTLEDWWFTPES